MKTTNWSPLVGHLDIDVDDGMGLRPVARSQARGARVTRPTAIGPALVYEDGTWSIDVRSVPVIHGLSVLSRALTEMVVAQARSSRILLAVERRLRHREHPELVEAFGIDSVYLVAEPSMLERLARDPKTLEWRLRAFLGALERRRYRDVLLPGDRRRSLALLADFREGRAQRFVGELIASRRDVDRSALRITIEDAGSCRLALDTVPHVVIEDVEEHGVIAGSTRIAQSWTEAIRHEAERGRRSYSEGRSPHSHLFEQLARAGLSTLQTVTLRWSEDAQPFLLQSDPAEISALFNRLLLAGEDAQLRRLLEHHGWLRVDAGPVPVFLDLTQLGRVLEISIGRRHERKSADDFLARMPRTREVVDAVAEDGPLSGVRVFLVHHMTAEIVGLIGGLRRLGCRDLVCLFVSYSGEPPASYLDAVLELPPQELQALTLVNVPTPGHVEGRYRLSARYSYLREAAEIAKALEGRDGEYLTAMRAAAVVPFLRQVHRAAAAGDRCLLIEDGGYLGPVLNDALMRDVTTRTFAAELGHVHAEESPLRSFVGSRLLATVEHTRNGFDRLAAVQERHGRLARPAYSIAISKLKREVESREVAASVLTAVETVLHAEGRILSRRSCLVLGSRGAIGRELVRSLRSRLDDPTAITGVDLQADRGRSALDHEVQGPDELSETRWLDTDLVLGVTGKSVLRGEHLEHWLCEGRPQVLVLASGSTKKHEFRELMEWFDGLCGRESAQLRGRALTVRCEELQDPRTARLYGHRWHFRFADGRLRTVLALGNLTPINFLFYGVATELIDEVLAQLLTLSLGAVRNETEPEAPPRLLAVDRDVDEHGRPLALPLPSSSSRAANGPELPTEVAELVRALDLQPHPEGGFYRETWRDQPSDGSRGHGTAIYFLLPGGVESHWHRVDAAELWHYYAGAPLELSMGADPEAPQQVVRLGPNVASGERPQGVVPAHAWQSARSTGGWTLVGCTVCPAFEFAGFELA